MKKTITSIAALILALLIGGGAVLATASNRSVATSQNLIAKTDAELQSLNSASQSFEKDETVYLITDQTGKVNKTFIGSTLSSSSEALPVEMKITYFLDGNEISASELAGKSGHVKIKYDYNGSKYYQGKLVPFFAVTGLNLNSRIFKNLKLGNGKIIKESQDSILVVGYSFVGLNENLNTDFLPSSFSIEADAENFELGTAYTLATNELFADLDTSKLYTIDGLVGQMNQLSSGLDQLISGSEDLASGLDSALLGAKKLRSGASELDSGAIKLASGAETLSSGLHELSAGAMRLSGGLDSAVSAGNQIMTQASAIAAAVQAKTADINNIITRIAETNPDLASALDGAISELSGYYSQVYSAIGQFAPGIEQLAGGADTLEKGIYALTSGADELAGGATTLAGGVKELSNGTTSLVDGLEQLANGGQTLNNGLKTFKEQGISKLVDFANRDLSSFSRNLRLSVEAAGSYHSYNNTSANSVKFIFKTPSVSRED